MTMPKEKANQHKSTLIHYVTSPNECNKAKPILHGCTLIIHSSCVVDFVLMWFPLTFYHYNLRIKITFREAYFKNKMAPWGQFLFV